MDIKVNNKLVPILLFFFWLSSFTAFFINVVRLPSLYGIIGWLWTTVFFVSSIVCLNDISASLDIKRLLFICGFVRMGSAIIWHVLWVKGMDPGSDQPQFMRASIGTFQSHFTGEPFYDIYKQSFTELLAFLYHIWGVNDIVIRAVYVLLWAVGLWLMGIMAGRFKGKIDACLICVYTFLPGTFFWDGLVMREALKQFFLMLSFYFLWKWMKTGKRIMILFSIIGAFPSIWLHSGDLAMYAVVFVSYFLWDPIRRCWRCFKIKQKHLYLIIVALLSPQIIKILKVIAPGRIRHMTSMQSVYTYINTQIEISNIAGSNYVDSMKTISSFPEFLAQTVYRMIMFWISPDPTRWNKASQVICFFSDTIPWLILWGSLFAIIYRYKYKGCGKVIGWIFFFFTLLYAWGATNGGNAMRHRGHFVGIVIMCAIVIIREIHNPEKSYGE